MCLLWAGHPQGGAVALGCGVCGHSLREPLPQPQGFHSRSCFFINHYPSPTHVLSTIQKDLSPLVIPACLGNLAWCAYLPFSTSALQVPDFAWKSNETELNDDFGFGAVICRLSQAESPPLLSHPYFPVLLLHCLHAILPACIHLPSSM